MTDLSTVQTNADRKAVCDAAVIEQNQAFLDAQAAAKLASEEAHFTRSIAAWCNETETNTSTAVESTKSISESLISSATLDSWETDLTAKGYSVTRENGQFTIALV